MLNDWTTAEGFVGKCKLKLNDNLHLTMIGPMYVLQIHRAKHLVYCPSAVKTTSGVCIDYCFRYQLSPEVESHWSRPPSAVVSRQHQVAVVESL